MARVNRQRIVVTVAGIGVLALAVGVYFMAPLSGPSHIGAAVKSVIARFQPTKVDWPARLHSVAGSGLSGTTDGAAAQSRFTDPFGVAVDASGNLYVADGGDSNRIRKINKDGLVTTVAGAHEGFADGAPNVAAFNTPSGLGLDRKGNLYVADTGNHAIRKIAPNGQVTTLAGNGKPGYVDGKGALAQFNGPVAVAVDRDGVVYVADTYNDRIRRIAADGSVTTVAGMGQPGLQDGKGDKAAFDTPSGIAVGKKGALYVADTSNDAIRKIDKDGVVSTMAVAPEERSPVLKRPIGIALTHDGYLYIASSSGGRILQMKPSGEYAPLRYADAAQADRGSDGVVRLYGPRGIALEPEGSVVVADALAYRIDRLAAPRRGEPPAQPIVAPTAPRPPTMPWPVSPQFSAHEVVGLMGEVRGSYDGESRDHFHAGLDVKADVGERVLAVAASKVTDPMPDWGFGTLTEGMSIGPISYIHMRVGRDSRGKALDPRFEVIKGPRNKPVRVRVARGTRFAVGDPIGTVNAMAHVHLDYFPGGPVTNPLSLPFAGISDHVPPQIQSVALYDSTGARIKPTKGHRLRVPRTAGRVSIVVDAFDQMDGNLARRRLGLYKLGYQLLTEDGKPLPGFEQPVITQVYDRLPRYRDSVKVVYAPNSGITVYGSKATHFAYDVTNTLLNGQAAPGSWNVGAMQPGDYILRIYAADFAGHAAVEGRDLALTVD
jgi:sugar lactone lactonase YvrE